jgi:hypothetical protein
MEHGTSGKRRIGTDDPFISLNRSLSANGSVKNSDPCKSLLSAFSVF